MKLYLLATNIGGYDSYDGHVIAAESEHEARLFAIEEAAEEGVKAWNTENSSIKIIADHTNEPAGIILSSFNGG